MEVSGEQPNVQSSSLQGVRGPPGVSLGGITLPSLSEINKVWYYVILNYIMLYNITL